MEQKTQEHTQAQERRPALVGFLSIEYTSDKVGFIGAILVTDDRGYPMEFRCTTPVRPTSIQKTLYGSLLKPYVSNELCGKRLITEIQRKPSLVIVQSQELLFLSTSYIPIFMLQLAGQVISTESLSNNLDRQRIESSTGKFQPIVISASKNTAIDFNQNITFINDLFSKFDLLEPFVRIKTALKALSDSDPKYR